MLEFPAHIVAVPMPYIAKGIIAFSKLFAGKRPVAGGEAALLAKYNNSSSKFIVNVTKIS
jgi:hypothetical protein